MTYLCPLSFQLCQTWKSRASFQLTIRLLSTSNTTCFIPLPGRCVLRSYTKMLSSDSERCIKVRCWRKLHSLPMTSWKYFFFLLWLVLHRWTASSAILKPGEKQDDYLSLRGTPHAVVSLASLHPQTTEESLGKSGKVKSCDTNLKKLKDDIISSQLIIGWRTQKRFAAQTVVMQDS